MTDRVTEPVPVTVAAPRQPMLLIGGLGALVVLLAAALFVVQQNGSRRDEQLGQLACQVEQLGGKPLGAKCPPSPKPAVRPKSPAVVTVQPRRPTAPRASSRPVSQPRPSPHPAPRSSPKPSPKPSGPSSPRPSPSPSCVRPPLLPLSVCQ